MYCLHYYSETLDQWVPLASYDGMPDAVAMMRDLRTTFPRIPMVIEIGG